MWLPDSWLFHYKGRGILPNYNFCQGIWTRTCHNLTRACYNFTRTCHNLTGVFSCRGEQTKPTICRTQRGWALLLGLRYAHSSNEDALTELMRISLQLHQGAPLIHSVVLPPKRTKFLLSLEHASVRGTCRSCSRGGNWRVVQCGDVHDCRRGNSWLS